MNSLTRLKTIGNQMESQITETICSSFFDELSTIKEQYDQDASFTTLLKMMQSLGKYLSTRKDTAHKETVPVLLSIIDIADTIARQPVRDTDETQKMLSKQIEAYKLFQDKLSSTPPINPTDIENLNAVILAIDWEISDKTLGNFEAELNRQLIVFNAYSIHHSFLKIMHSTGRYIAAQKANAHTDSISFLQSVFKNFELLVESPDMLFKDKKQLLENEIKRFNDFKLKISEKPLPKQPQPPETSNVIDDDIDDEPVTPALSHLKSPSDSHLENDNISSITALDIDEQPDNDHLQTVTPALSEKKPPKNQPKDVMGDLFTIKESPADELLDAIHLLDVHGSNPDQAMTMLDSADDLDKDGVEKYTPKRIDTDPIPEIGDRLDEFFNLDTTAPDGEKPTPDPEELVETELPPLEPEPPAISDEDEDNEDNTESITPFDHEDETQDIEDDTIEKEQMLHETLNRLKSYFKSFDSVADESWHTLIQEDLSFLRRHWEENSDKVALLDILESVLQLLDNQMINVAPETPKDIKDPPKGLWQKIKALFFILIQRKNYDQLFVKIAEKKNTLAPTQLIGGKAVFTCAHCGYQNAYTMDLPKTEQFKRIDSFLKKTITAPHIIGAFVLDLQKQGIINHMPGPLKNSDLQMLGKLLVDSHGICLTLYPDIEDLTLQIAEKTLILKIINQTYAIVIVTKTKQLPEIVKREFSNLISRL